MILKNKCLLCFLKDLGYCNIGVNKVYNDAVLSLQYKDSGLMSFIILFTEAFMYS